MTIDTRAWRELRTCGILDKGGGRGREEEAAAEAEEELTSVERVCWNALPNDVIILRTE